MVTEERAKNYGPTEQMPLAFRPIFANILRRQTLGGFMRFLSDVEWMVLNDLVLKIYAIEDDIEFRREIMMALRPLIPYDDAAFFLTDQSKIINTAETWKTSKDFLDPVGIDAPQQMLLDYATTYYANDPMNDKGLPLCSKVIRESDYLTEEDRSTSYFRKHLKSRNVLTCLLFFEERHLGFLQLNRFAASGDFSDREIQILSLVEPHLTNRLARWRVLSKCSGAEALFYQRYSISNREQDVTRCVAEGMSNPAIANELCISTSTVKKHLESIFQKTGVKNRFELISLMKEEA